MERRGLTDNNIKTNNTNPDEQHDNPTATQHLQSQLQLDEHAQRETLSMRKSKDIQQTIPHTLAAPARLPSTIFKPSIIPSEPTTTSPTHHPNQRKLSLPPLPPLLAQRLTRFPDSLVIQLSTLIPTPNPTKWSPSPVKTSKEPLPSAGAARS